jgi:cytochrome c oxidase cbb3-type subunit 1
MVFSLMLIAPSWGGMINGLMTLKGNYEEVRTNPVLKFFVVALSFYGMSTFEGPMLSIKSVSALGHYTDWIVGHVHSGALGWVGFCIFATFYWLVPKLYDTKLYSEKLATAHFWTGTIGIVLYITSMWITGVTQGLMWRAFSPDGTLTYSFIETVKVLFPYYVVRAFGGILYLSGTVMCCYNLWMTARQGKPVVVRVPTYSEGSL